MSEVRPAEHAAKMIDEKAYVVRFFVPKQKNERTVILKADDQTIILNLGRDGKLQARTSSWEDPKVFRDGDRPESAGT